MPITDRLQASVANEVRKDLLAKNPGTKASVAEVVAAVKSELTGELSAGMGLGSQAGNDYKPHPVSQKDPRLSAADQQVNQTPSATDNRKDQSVDANAPQKQLTYSPAAQKQLGMGNTPSAAPELTRK